MANPSRMPRYDVRNDGAGPYAIFYCDLCEREYRSTPNIGASIARDVGQDMVGGFLRRIPIVGDSIANGVDRNDPRYTYDLNPQQLNEHWNQVSKYFRECSVCHQITCLSCFDEQAGTCNDDSPRKDEIAEARGQQAGAALKGIANVFGFGAAIEQAGKAMEKAQTQLARCPNCENLSAPGTKFCPDCGTAMVQPVSTVCPKCGTDTKGAKFCPNCGTRQETQPAAAPAHCPNCGAETNGAKFCASCGTKLI